MIIHNILKEDLIGRGKFIIPLPMNQQKRYFGQDLIAIGPVPEAGFFSTKVVIGLVKGLVIVIEVLEQRFGSISLEGRIIELAVR